MVGKYKLNPDHSVEPIEDLYEWAYAFENCERQIALTNFHDPEEVTVSTVFLGLDFSFTHYEGPPVVFETMVFGGKLDRYQERYCTWDQALRGHQEICDKVEWGHDDSTGA